MFQIKEETVTLKWDVMYVLFVRLKGPGYFSHLLDVCVLPDTEDKRAHTLTWYSIWSPVDLQIVFAAVALAALQSTIEDFSPCLCFLYHHIKIFPMMSSLLQVGEREIIWLGNQLTFCLFSCQTLYQPELQCLFFSGTVGERDYSRI